jgi:hypothetical protein
MACSFIKFFHILWLKFYQFIYDCVFCMLPFNCVDYLFLLLNLCILIVMYVLLCMFCFVCSVLCVLTLGCLSLESVVCCQVEVSVTS